MSVCVCVFVLGSRARDGLLLFCCCNLYFAATAASCGVVLYSVGVSWQRVVHENAWCNRHGCGWARVRRYLSTAFQLGSTALFGLNVSLRLPVLVVYGELNPTLLSVPDLLASTLCLRACADHSRPMNTSWYHSSLLSLPLFCWSACDAMRIVTYTCAWKKYFFFLISWVCKEKTPNVLRQETLVQIRRPIQ